MEDRKKLSLKKDEAENAVEMPSATDSHHDLDDDLKELAELRAEKAARIDAESKKKEAEENAAITVILNLPPASGKGIQLGGRMYVHGQAYQVTNDVKWALEEAQNRCWAHESSLRESENKGRTKRRAYVG